MFFINHFVQPETCGGIHGTPNISHPGASCILPALYCRKLLVKDTNFLKESNLLTHDCKKDNSPNG